MAFQAMSMRFQILGSSSRGNCSLLEAGDTRVLIDAGFTGKRICELLEECHVRIDDIHAVFVTHEHGDHVAGLRGLGKYRHLECFANLQTAKAAQAKLTRDLRWRIFESGQSFRFRDLEVQSFRVPHDAYEPVGFVFRAGAGDLFSPERSMAWMTDLGYIPESLKPIVSNVHALVLEANHDLEMLENDATRPFSTKQRIRGRHGHLSNDAALDFVAGQPDAHWRRVLLAHVSRDCNTVERVREVFQSPRHAYPVDVIDPDSGPCETVDLFHL